MNAAPKKKRAAPATPKRGRPPKSDGGLGEVLFIRCSADLIEALDAALEAEREKHPGRSISRADLAREMLYRALKK